MENYTGIDEHLQEIHEEFETYLMMDLDREIEAEENSEQLYNTEIGIPSYHWELDNIY